MSTQPQENRLRCSSYAKTIIEHTGLALNHYRETCPDITRKSLIASSGNSVIVQILEHGKMGEDADLAQAITETELILAALRVAAHCRGLTPSARNQEDGS